MEIVLVAVNAKFIHSSLALHSLRAYLGEERKYVKIKEFTLNQSEELILSELFALKPNVIAFSCYIWNISLILSLMSNLKKIMPGLTIVLGGPEVSYDNEDLYALGADIIIAGEGEQAFSDLVKTLLGSAPLSPASSTVALEDIPFPYPEGFGDFKNRIIYYESSRGCANHCGYCLSPVAHKTVRFLPIERVKSDLSVFLSANVPQVKFIDRSFNCQKGHAMELWSYLISNDNGLSNFHFEIAGDLLDDDMIALISRARKGLFQFEIGVQSTNKLTLESLRRNTDTGKLFDNVRKLKEAGNVHLHLDLIAGLPYEDYLSFKQSFNDVMACRPNKLQLGFLKLLKGSQLRKDAAKYGIKFKDRAPYEILENDFISFENIDRLKKLEHMLDSFYNSGAFQSYVEYMMQQFASPFDFFEALSIFWEVNKYHLVSHKKSALYGALYEFSHKDRLLCELLKFDMLMRDNIRSFPSWIMEYYSFDWKALTRTTAIHTFEYDIISWLNQPSDPLQKKHIKVMFNYSSSSTCAILDH